MKLISVLVMVFLTLFSTSSFAGSVQMGLWFPWSFVNQEINQIPVNLQYNQDQVQMQILSLQPQLKNVHVELSGQFVQNQFTEKFVQNSFLASSSILIGEIAIDQVIKKEIAGNIINIRMQAICRGFAVQVPNFQVNLTSHFQQESHYWKPVLDQVDIQIVPNSWSKSIIECVGPQGINQYLTQLVDEQLNNPVFIEKMIHDWMSDQIQEKWVSLWKNLLQSTEKTFVNVKMNAPQSGGISIYGSMLTSGSNNVLLPDVLNFDQPSISNPTVLLSQAALSELTNDQLAKIVSEKRNLQEVQGFRKLMRSRLMQFFVWPDLMKFGKSSPFYLKADSQKQKIKMTKTNSDKAYRVDLQLLGQIEGEREGLLVDYIDWSIGLTSKVEPEILDGQLILKLKNTQSQMNWKMNDSYVQKFKPSKRVPETTIRKSIESVLQTPQVHLTLPSFQWKNQIWKMNSWNQSNEWILIPWSGQEP